MGSASPSSSWHMPCIRNTALLPLIGRGQHCGPPGGRAAGGRLLLPLGEMLEHCGRHLDV